MGRTRNSEVAKRVLVIGSGLTGATLANLHSSAGDLVTVLEKSDHVGGSVYTRLVRGIMVHMYGAHIFHTNNKEVWDYITSFSDFNSYTHIVKSSCKGKLYSIPINLNTFNEFFKITKPEEISDEYKNIVRKCLVQGYTEKQWGTSIDNVAKTVTARLPFRENKDDRYFTDKYQGIPGNGYTSIIHKMLEGSKVITGIKVNRHFDFTKYDVVYNTGPIDEFLEYSLGRLPYRSLRFEHEYLKIARYQDYAVVNYADKDVPFTRVIEHRHFTNTAAPYTIITREYPCQFTGEGERYYPVLSEANLVLYNKYIESSKKQYPNMIFCGRQGSYQYLDMDDAIEQAINLYKSNN